MDKLEMQTKNLAEEKFKKLQELFPNAVTETIDEDGKLVKAIDKDTLMQEISTEVVEGREERYQFTWPDKRNAILTANAPISKTLRPCKDESVNFDDTKNLYIEGDNLEVLKLLQETYLGKIKVIYIDPPYNTGHDFIYNHDFKQTEDDYVENSGQYDNEGNRLEKNLESNGRFHTDWLNMMYSRLKLARNLLTEDGIIFISIDEREFSNLKKICDEVFSEKNFVTQFIWEKTAHFGRQKKNYYSNAEFILCYGKEIYRDGLLKELLVERIDSDLEDAPLYNNSNPINDLTFPVGSVSFRIPDGTYSESLDPKFKILEPVEVRNGKNINELKIRMKSRWSQRKIDEEYKKGSIYLVKSDKFSVRVIYAEDKTTNVSLKQLIFTNRNNPLCAYDRFGTKVGTNDEASGEVNNFLGDGVFSYPKPISLIKYLLSSIYDDNNNGYLNDFIALDFFSGSASTADAIMQLNAHDGGTRKFIMVQLPEETDRNSEAYKAGYKNICEIGKERIRRAGKKIIDENKDKEGIDNLDIGFRVLKTDTSNMKDVYYAPAEIEQSLLDLLSDNIKEDRTPDDLLFQIMLDLGISLSSKIERDEIDNKEVFIVEDGFLIACFDKNINDDIVKVIANKKPYYAVFRDSSMANDSVATNFEQIFESISPQTVRKVI